MTEATETTDLESLHAIEARVADFLQRRRLSRWTEADTLELDAWLAESTAHRVAYLRFKKARRSSNASSAGVPPSSTGSSRTVRAASWCRFFWRLRLR